jgi:YidC/Oxa1 family membrane protein insertase
MPVLLGVFQVLRTGAESVRFLWISSLARPDVFLAVLAGITTALMMAANPDIPEQTRMFVIILPSVIAVVFALKFASALALYWVASNLFTAAQTSAVHFVVGRRIRSGQIAI